MISAYDYPLGKQSVHFATLDEGAQKAGNGIASLLVQLIASLLLDATHPTTRVTAAFLAFNLSVPNYLVRREEQREGLEKCDQVELSASLLEALASEEASDEAVKGLLLGLGCLVYCAPREGELIDLCSPSMSRVL